MNKLSTVRYNVTLTQEEFDKIMNLVDDQLAADLREVTHIPAAKHMYFVNVYDIDQAYGGPEEGGWYYHTHDCHTSIGIFCDPCDGEPQFTRDHRFDELITTALQYLQSFEPKWQDDEIFNDLNEYGCFTAYNTDRYGCGELVEISRTPGNRHDTRRQYYE